MSIKNILLAGAAVTFLASTAMAAEPTKLTDAQMDDVAAGFTLTGGVALTGGYDARRWLTLNAKESSKVKTKETINVNNSGFNGLQETDSSASIDITSTSRGNGRVQTGGTLAVGFSLSN